MAHISPLSFSSPILQLTGDRESIIARIAKAAWDWASSAQGLSLFGGTGQSNYSVSFGKQFRDQRTTDGSRSACNKNLHL
jgi:hypothetical protein